MAVDRITEGGRPAPGIGDPPRVGILVVAYNAADTLAATLSRIPEDFGDRLAGVLVSDDASVDSTFEIGTDFAASHPELPLTVVRQEVNLGYGGNQKFGYRWAIANGIDIVVLLHGDGQYAPELLPDMVAPIATGEADAVFGSRMMVEGAALRGGMPLYKFVGNRILTRVENALAGVDLSEWHSGYRAYRVETLRQLPFGANSDGFDFDTQIIVELIESGARIVEIPIPTYYGDEISHVNGIRHAIDIVRHVATYRLHRIGFGSGALAFASSPYEEKFDEHSSHVTIPSMIDRPGLRVLDLGCGQGHVSQRLRDAGHRVVGVDIVEFDGVRERTDEFVRADLSEGWPPVTGVFDVVLAADVIEHLAQPEELLERIGEHLAPGGEVIVSIPNFAHWYPRIRVATGRFDYDRRGILDRGHLRFFTRRSFTAMAERSGFAVGDVRPVGIPLEVSARTSGGAASRSDRRGLATRWLGAVDRRLCRRLPSLFAYQFVLRLRPLTTPDVPPGSSRSTAGTTDENGHP